VAATAANVHDSQLRFDLLHGNETRVWGNSAYAGEARGAARAGAARERLYSPQAPSLLSVE